jgi:hypothetical protein
MMISKNNLFASLALCAAVVGAKMAQADGFKFGGGSGNNGNSKSSFKINFNVNGSSQNKLKNGSSFKKYVDVYTDKRTHRHTDKHCRIRYIQPVHSVYSQCYHPQFGGCYVYPGDTWYSISKRAYGVGFLSQHIATYNRLPINSLLVPGQMLRLPVVNSNGTLSASNAPMPAPYAPNGVGSSALSTYASTTNISAAGAAAPMSEPTLVQVPAGSTLMLDIESLGTERGSVRLRLGSLSLPVAVMEWTPASVKVELPKMELSRSVKSSLEVVRADGSVVSQSAIELTPAATQLALGN